jgi:hypothetical protein
MKRLFLVLLVLLPLIVAGCKATKEEAEQNFCLALGELGQALAAVENLHSRSTVDEAEQAQKNLDDAIKEVQDAAAKLQEVRLDAAVGAFDNLKSEIQSISGDATLKDAQKMVLDSAESFRDEIDALYDISCN